MPDGDDEIDDGDTYRWGSREEETINPKAEIEALKVEIEPVEKTLEVKLHHQLLKDVEKIAEPAPEVKEPEAPT